MRDDHREELRRLIGSSGSHRRRIVSKARVARLIEKHWLDVIAPALAEFRDELVGVGCSVRIIPFTEWTSGEVSVLPPSWEADATNWRPSIMFTSTNDSPELLVTTASGPRSEAPTRAHYRYDALDGEVVGALMIELVRRSWG